MISTIDFSMSYLILLTIIVCGSFPIILFFVAKIKKTAGRNALQFLIACVITTVILFLIIAMANASMLDNLTSFLLYYSALFIYLEIWGLLSRGYTLGMLLTFYKINRPITIEELAKLYRGGEGLDWLIRHRFKGLAAARLIEIDKNKFFFNCTGNNDCINIWDVS